MTIQVQIEVEAETLINALRAMAEMGDRALEYKMINELPHAAIVEYGSGIYSEADDSTRQPITPKSSSLLIIPVLLEYIGKRSLSPEIQDEARKNAKNSPAIMATIKSRYGSAIGFILRKSVKGQRPARMVRNNIKEIPHDFANNFANFLANSNGSRLAMADAVNKTGNSWFVRIVKDTPILTSKLWDGWKVLSKAT